MAVKIIEAQADNKRLRTCAYIRVSTEHEGQLKSYENQEAYYKEKIVTNPEYEFVGVYGDEGMSGMSPDREGLQSMLEDMRAGHIDLILTKSISRLARNTTTVLSIVREARELGVGIIFEEEGIETKTEEGEMMLTLLSAFAAEERKNVSENLQWAARKRFEAGIVQIDTNRFLGYKKDKAGKLVIVEEEAALVKRIYEEYISGKSAYRIAKDFNEEGVISHKVDSWSGQRILRMMKNEKYKGDCLLQKSYISPVTKKQTRNHGDEKRYYICNDHEPIVSRTIWEEANVRMAAEKQKRKLKPHAGKYHCPYCGRYLRRHRKWKEKYDWVCGNYIENTMKACKGIKVPEILLDQKCFEEEMTVEEVVLDGKEDFSFIPYREWCREHSSRSEEVESSSVLPRVIRQRRTAIKLSKPDELL